MVAGGAPGNVGQLGEDNGASSTAVAPARGRAWAETQDEVRLAMGWNGGVSLAIWMGGVAVELDESRRIDPGKVQEGAPATAGSTEGLYQSLAKAFNRRLVIDILAGASAGGLNGALLAGVIIHDKKLRVDWLREKWLEIGDFGELLKPLDEAKPTSIMRGQKFFDEVEEAFVDLLGPDKPAASSDELPVLLDVQVTNVAGHEREFLDDWDLPFRALEHRAPVQFRERKHFNAKALATAARASASFPGAFEAQKISDPEECSPVVPHTTWAVDGGLLENAPIRQAIELIPQRRASGPVRRYVCYVNAAPTAHREQQEMDEPGLRQVIGYAINLPRTGRVVDQLYALEDATRRAGLTATIGVELVGLKTDDLLLFAERLLPAYQRRRGALSLEELLAIAGPGGPGRAQRILAALASDANAPDNLARGAAALPWIPAARRDIVDAGSAGHTWRFGIRAAQRIVQLELDLLRAALLDTDAPDAATTIFKAREKLDDAFRGLEGQRRGFLAPQGEPVSLAERLAEGSAARAKALADLELSVGSSGAEARKWVERATRSFYKAMRAVAPEQARALFARLPAEQRSASAPQPDPAPLEEELLSARFRAFVARALAVEVIRRSFSDDLDIESAQTLHVAQLTPLTESPLFDRGYPQGPGKRPAGAPPVAARADKNLGPSTTREKLAGVRLGHFAGFYRRSWRANDFMWGRLDGAAMIARLLIDTDRARARAEITAEANKPWHVIADALVPATSGSEETEADKDRRALLEEHLGKQENLREAVAAALKADLLEGSGELTRSLVARALQYQILREELPQLIDAVKKDRRAGASPSPVQKWPTAGSLNDAIAALRRGRGQTSLPGLLGADDRDEATSQLALRTLSHTLLVATAALGGVVPLGRLLQPLRLPLLSIQGSSAKRPLDRLAAAVAFTGASWYISARLLALISGQTDPARKPQNGKVPLNAIWTSPVLAYWVSALAVVGFAAVPLLRTIRSRRWQRILLHGLAGTLLLASAGLILLVETIRRAGTSEALTTWSAPDFAPKTILVAVGIAGALHAASTSSLLLRAVAFGQRLVRRWIAPTSLLYAAIAIVLAIYAAKHGLPHSCPPQPWRRVAFIAAIAAPLLALTYVRPWAGWNREGR